MPKIAEPVHVELPDIDREEAKYLVAYAADHCRELYEFPNDPKFPLGAISETRSIHWNGSSVIYRMQTRDELARVLPPRYRPRLIRAD